MEKGTKKKETPYASYDMTEEIRYQVEDAMENDISLYDYVLARDIELSNLWEQSREDHDKFMELVEENNLDGSLEEDLWNEIGSDPLVSEMAMENVTDALTELMNKVAKKNHMEGTDLWRAEVKGFGWRGLSGQREFRAETGDELLRNVLPAADNTFYIYDRGDHIAINNFHHDAPTGREWYEIYPGWDEEE